MFFERVFFIINYFHNKIRNNLILKRVNKLQNIYINERFLKKKNQNVDRNEIVKDEKCLIATKKHQHIEKTWSKWK